MKFKITCIYTSAGASFASNGSVRSNVVKDNYNIEADDEKDAIEKAKILAKRDEFFGNFIDIIVHNG